MKKQSASATIKKLKKHLKVLKKAKVSVATRFILSDLRAKKEKYNIKD